MSIDVKAYERLLNPGRIRLSTKGKRATVVETGSDRGRIVFSSAFRRLQQKAQVFPLDPNASVRTRLTHSLEVAHTGRYLAQEILYQLRDRAGSDYSGSWLQSHEQVFYDVVESACLIHDIGNPPFGHFGEAAIRGWFSDAGRDVFSEFASGARIAKKDIDRYMAHDFLDFLAFDGNPQGLRLISKLQGDDGLTGLNLTYPLLMAYLKYCCLPENSKLARSDGDAKKPGFFSTEAAIIEEASTKLGIDYGARHPLSYIMEAADDISYCMSDIEDGMEKGVVTADSFFDDVSSIWTKAQSESEGLSSDYIIDLIDESRRNSAVSPFTAFKTTIISLAVAHAADTYCDAHEEVMCGRHEGLVRDNSEIVTLLKAVKKFVRLTVFRSAEAESVELAGYSTIKGLLDHFSPLLLLPSDSFQELMRGNRVVDEDYCLRLINRLSKKAREVYKKEATAGIPAEKEWHSRAHLIVDHVSGMTDHFAVQTYQLLAGIKIST